MKIWVNKNNKRMIIMKSNNKEGSYFQEMMNGYVYQDSLMNYLEPNEQMAIFEILSDKGITNYFIEPLHIQGRHGVFVDLRYSDKVLMREELNGLMLNNLYSISEDRLICDENEIIAIQLFTFTQCVQPRYNSLISEMGLFVELNRSDKKGRVNISETDKEKINTRQHEIIKALKTQEMFERYVEIIENQMKSVEMIKEYAPELIEPIHRHLWV